VVKIKAKVKERVFTTTDPDGNGTKLVCIRPNQDVLDGARLEYNVVFAKALRLGCLMRVEAEEIIEKRKLWSSEHESNIQNLRLELRKLEVQLAKEKDKVKGAEVAKKMAAIRDDIQSIVVKRNDIHNRTAESLAETAQNQYLVVRCILDYDSRQPYFTSMEKFKELENSQLLADSTSELMLFLMDMTPDDLLSTPESQWLVKQGLRDKTTGFWIRGDRLYTDDGKRVNEKGEFLTEDGVRCDEFGIPLVEEEVLSDTEENTAGAAAEMSVV
jgi:hypothetical protein